MVKCTCKFAEKAEELALAADVKREVFAIEQGIPPALVFDGYDTQARHVIAVVNGEIVGTTRVRYVAAGQAKLERMAVLSPFRRQGIGGEMLAFLIDTLRRDGIEKLLLHAQNDAADFYRGCGFIGIGEPFLEAGIEHLMMEREI